MQVVIHEGRAWLATVLLLAPAVAATEAPAPKTFEIPPGSGEIEEFLSCELGDGMAVAWPTAADMPWRVSIGMPRKSPAYGSRKDARNAAVESMELWARSIRTQLPWFQLEFIEKDKAAPVQIKWKRRTSGSIQGQAGPLCAMRNGRIIAGGRMEIALQSCPTCSSLTVDEVRVLVTHEFGHVLGLGHCLGCDSAMNYSWQTEGRTLVTAVDVDAIVRRIHMSADNADDAAGEAAPEARLDPDDLVELAAGNDPVSFIDATCDEPFALSRSCSESKGPRKRKKIESLEIRFAGTKDGRAVLVTPEDPMELARLGVATQSTNERFYVVIEKTESRGVKPIRATALVARGQVLGYLIEFDGNAWKALGL